MNRGLAARAIAALCLLLAAAAAEPQAAAASARGEAERQLAELRARVHGEQAALLQRLQAATAAAAAARQRRDEAEHAAAEAEAAARRTGQDSERGQTLAQQLADRVVAAARLDAERSRELAALPPDERAAAAIAALLTRAEALPTRLARRLADETVIGRDGRAAMAPVLRLGEARAVALGADPAQRGLIERAADGAHWLVAGPALPDATLPQAGLVQAIALDASGRAARTPEAARRSLAEWLAAGRAFIWPILAVLAIGLGIVIARGMALARSRVDPRRLLQIAASLAAGDRAGALAAVAGRATPLDAVLGAGLDAIDRPREAREAAVEAALIGATGQLTRGLTAIAVLAGVAPLLGLLGTVTGMIDMFSVLASQGPGSARSLSGGIAEALICTQAGMLVAIPLLLCHAWLSRIADRRGQLLEEAACGVLGLDLAAARP